MPTLTLSPNLYKRAEEIAEREHTSLPEIFETALNRYLWELDRRKISEESATYRLLHDDIKKQYLGQYIAMLNGEIVDHDPDFQTLRQRIRERFGENPVLMTLVEESSEKVYTRRGFRKG
jgi:hypothetical protein